MLPTVTRPLFGQDLDRMFRAFFESSPASRGGSFPATNVWETDTGYRLEAELPGVTQESIELTVLGNRLMLRGKYPEAGTDASYRRRERPSGTFQREITLPTQLDPEGVEATLNQGLLSVTLPKAREVLPRKIAVQGA